jgi:hypothetical protein
VKTLGIIVALVFFLVILGIMLDAARDKKKK